MKEYLAKIIAGGVLSREEAASVINRIMDGEVPATMTAAFLVAWKTRGETVDEIAGCAAAMRAHALQIPVQRRDLVDTCGTGGSGTDTFNISTTNAFLLAGAGLGVVKHGNRSASSRCGSADVLEELGVPIDLPPEQVAKMVDETGFGFLFARTFHPAMKHVGPVRAELGVRTVFNILGPLTNPAGAKRQVIGVFDPDLPEVMARVLRELGSEEVMVVHGEDDGVDEISLAGPTRVAHLKDGEIKTTTITPESVGLTRAPLAEVRGGDAAENAGITTALLQGELKGPKRDILMLNAAAALQVAGKVADLREGVALAGRLLDQGKWMEVLEKVRGR